MKLGILILIFGVYFVYSERKSVFIGRQLNCKECNRKYFYNVTCRMKMINKNKQTYSMHVFIKPVVIENLHFRMRTYYKFRTQYRPHAVVVDEDACAFLKFLNGTKLISLSNFKNLPIGIFNFTCPIKGPRNLTMNDIEFSTLDDTRMPDFVDIGDWIFETIPYTIFDGKEILLTKIILEPNTSTQRIKRNDPLANL